MEVRTFKDQNELAAAAARLFVELALNTTTAGDKANTFTVALSGGNTPRGLYALLAEDPYRESVPWQRVHLFFGDERCVGPDAPESNYGMVRDILLDKVEIPTENVHRIQGETPPVEAALAYEEEIRGFFNNGGQPVFDLVLLGLGTDGHTLSIFPGIDIGAVKGRLVVESNVDTPGVKGARVTMTPGLVNNAKNVIFLVSGAEKARVLKEVVEGTGEVLQYPASLIRPGSGRFLWLVDEDAGSSLTA